jgi:hypothetical protein
MRDRFDLIGVVGLIGVLCGLAGLRAAWLYGRSRTGPRFLLLAAGGLAIAIAGWRIASWPRWIAWLGVAVAVGPMSMWLVVRWLDYQGPPAGLVPGPAPLEAAEDAVEIALEGEIKRSPFPKPPGAGS